MAISANEQSIRLEALRFALGTGGLHGSGQIVTAAQTYVDFVLGRPNGTRPTLAVSGEATDAAIKAA